MSTARRCVDDPLLLYETLEGPKCDTRVRVQIAERGGSVVHSTLVGFEYSLLLGGVEWWIDEGKKDHTNTSISGGAQRVETRFTQPFQLAINFMATNIFVAVA